MHKLGPILKYLLGRPLECQLSFSQCCNLLDFFCSFLVFLSFFFYFQLQSTCLQNNVWYLRYLTKPSILYLQNNTD